MNMIQSFFLMYQRAFYDINYYYFFSLHIISSYNRNCLVLCLCKAHAHCAWGVDGQLMILPCISLTSASNVLYYNAQLYLWHEYYFPATVFMSILFVEESILRFTAMRQTMNRVTVRSRSPPLRKKKKSTQTPHIEIRPCKTSPPNNSVYGVFSR